jgi:hypothetical protein
MQRYPSIIAKYKRKLQRNIQTRQIELIIRKWENPPIFVTVVFSCLDIKNIQNLTNLLILIIVICSCLVQVSFSSDKLVFKFNASGMRHSSFSFTFSFLMLIVNQLVINVNVLLEVKISCSIRIFHLGLFFLIEKGKRFFLKWRFLSVLVQYRRPLFSPKMP